VTGQLANHRFKACTKPRTTILLACRLQVWRDVTGQLGNHNFKACSKPRTAILLACRLQACRDVTVQLANHPFKVHGLKSASLPIKVATTHIGRPYQHPLQQELTIRKVEAVDCSETSEHKSSARHRKSPRKRQ
jgi:hypothetical protein